MGRIFRAKALARIRFAILTAGGLSVLACGYQEPNFGECQEKSGSVSPACLYNGNYPACGLADAAYATARRRAWQFPTANFSELSFVDTGRSQDLGAACRFYFHARVELRPMEPYQWFVYVDKATLLPTHMEPVVW